MIKKKYILYFWTDIFKCRYSFRKKYSISMNYQGFRSRKFLRKLAKLGFFSIGMDHTPGIFWAVVTVYLNFEPSEYINNNIHYVKITRGKL